MRSLLGPKWGQLRKTGANMSHLQQTREPRTNKIDLFDMPVTHEVAGSSSVVPRVSLGYIMPTGRSDRDKKSTSKELAQRTHVVHNVVHTCARTARSAPSEMHRIRLKMRCSEQGERWRHGFLNRGSGVRISPGLPCFQ